LIELRRGKKDEGKMTVTMANLTTGTTRRDQQSVNCHFTSLTGLFTSHCGQF